jgi:hypothetical protein
MICSRILTRQHGYRQERPPSIMSTASVRIERRVDQSSCVRSGQAPDVLIDGFAEFDERSFACARIIVVPLERQLGSRHFHLEVTNGPCRDSGDLR